ncbi:hypothetical protein MVEG_00165 [Podila verticillata NRRL 6337]|nr:hypothetical protein MVEG_00165 [Podila verticillata NRRL 6337]
MTLDFENTVLATLPACLAIIAFIYRAMSLHRYGQPHGLGRANLVFWPSQALMLAAASVLIVRAGLIGREPGYSPASVIANASMGVAWVLAAGLDLFEHRFKIQSSSFILSYQFVSIVAGVITILSALQTRSTLSQQQSACNTANALYFTYFGIISFGLIMEVWPHSRKRVQQRSHRNLYEDANIFSRYCFHYLQSVITLGYRQPLQQTDIQNMMPQRIKTKFSHLHLSEQWGHHVARRSAKGKKPQLMLLVLCAYASQWVPIIIYRVLASALVFVAPELMNQLLGLVATSSSDTPQPVTLGVILSFGMFFSTIASSLLEGQCHQLVTSMGIEARTALISMVYRKALKLSPAARRIQSPGEISNHMSVDAEKWSEARIATLLSDADDRKLGAMDNRMRLTSDLISSMKIVKLYGWYSAFRSKVDIVRSLELAILRKIGSALSAMSVMSSPLTLLMAFVSFSVYAAIGGPGGTHGDINSQTIFVSITLFGLLNRPIGMFAHVISETVGLVIATRRIQNYLLEEELLDDQIQRFDYLPTEKSQPVIEIHDATNHEERNSQPTLKNINISVQEGHLTAIVGRVGQGKTSLFDAIIGNMYKLQGTVKMYGRVAYVPQQPWIINSSMRDNILFESPFDEERYHKIVHAAGLLPDIEMLPAGDQTEIGERGINLSGGQKQRISLARAAYMDADIYLLDDPLSAVDAHVDQHLWHNLIGPDGLLKDKTRLLITHGIRHLNEADQIVVMNGGSISEMGQYQELMDAKNAFYELNEDYCVKEVRKEQGDTIGEEAPTQDSNAGIMSRPEFHNIQEQAGKADEKWDDNADLITEETMKVGGIHWYIYIIYAKAASYRYAILVPILFGVIQCCQIGANTWLENWVQISDTTIHSISYFMGIYAILITSYILLFACTSHIALTTAAIRASERLHDSLLNNVLRLPMSFFDTTPAGRIVNRFSSDFFNIDVLIPFFILEALKCGVSALGSIIVISVTTPIFLVVVPPIVSIFIALQLYYTAASRSFRRIESTAMSPLHQHFFETLSGVSTIRALQCDERFIEQNASRADQASNAQFVRNIGERWLTVRLEALGSAIVLMASLFAVLGRNSLSPSMVGMSLSYALNITQDITYLVQSMCDVQFQMVSLERIDDYCNKSQEAPNFTDVQLPESWPSQGRISFKNYSTRYRQGVDLVLKNISFEVQPGEKVGIVGRTGAGKSSLTLALFRIIEAANSHWAKSSHNGPAADSGPSKTDIDAIDQEKVLVEEEEDGGSIWIDGVDISTVGLEHLRQRLAIIPQEPTLFEGTVRDNLDPFQQASDAEVWEALELAHLKEYISSLTGGLYFQVTRNGENFSVGQRSLVCLARALLRKTKILVLDEATASVDVETDDLIQKTIRKEFKDRTILTIAHRIKTVMDSDKILVLDKGRVQEYEAPSELLKRKESMFYRLAKQANEI